jgi:hypothetical protein
MNEMKPSGARLAALRRGFSEAAPPPISAPQGRDMTAQGVAPALPWAVAFRAKSPSDSPPRLFGADSRSSAVHRLNMKTVIYFVLVAFAVSASAVSLRVGTVRGFPGVTVEVPVSLRYGTNEARDVVALQADVLFDASGVSDAAPTSGPLLSQHLLASSQPAVGTRRLLVYSLANATLTNGVVANIPFTVGPGEDRNFPLTLANVILVRADASQVFATNVNGYLAVSQVFIAPDGRADGFLNVSSNDVEQCYVIQATTNFVNWVNVQTNSATGNLLEFADPTAGGHPYRFYRALVCDAVTGLRIGTITQLPDRQVRFEFSGASGLSYVIQASTNLTQWVNVRTNVGAGGTILFTDSVTNYPQRFYRLKSP